MSSSVPLLLVPGTLCDARLWRGQLPALAMQRTVEVVDWREERHVAALARRILDEAPPRFAIAGMSMGGSIALEACALEPSRITGLALLDAHPWADPPGRQDARQAQLAFAREHGLSSLVRQQLWPSYVHASRRGDLGLLALVQDMAESCGLQQFTRQNELLASRVERLGVLAELSIPVLIAAGAEDTLCPGNWQRMMFDCAVNAEVASIARCGHFAVLESPDEVLELLLRWLGRCDPALPSE